MEQKYLIVRKVYIEGRNANEHLLSVMSNEPVSAADVLELKESSRDSLGDWLILPCVPLSEFTVNEPA